VELLFRLEDDPERELWTEEDQSRSRSLGLLMEIARKCNAGCIEDSEDICHSLFASKTFPDGAAFPVPSEFEYDFSIWERYQERQCLKLGLYGFWHEINQLLQGCPSNTASTSEIVDHLARLAASSAVATSWLGRDALKQKVGTAMCPRRCKRAAVLPV
jgi:hypothetical protein